MFRRVFACAVTLVALAVAGSAAAAPIVYTTEASFLAATGALPFESFETATPNGATAVDFPGGTFSCTGGSWCPGFFGISSLGAMDGTDSVFFASPDTATFAFGAPITAFGIWIGGAGDVAPLTMTFALSNGGNGNALVGYTGAFDVFVTNATFFGVIDTIPFSSITFGPNNRDDGIFFDKMYTSGAAVPEPASMLLLGTGLAGLVAARRRRK